MIIVCSSNHDIWYRQVPSSTSTKVNKKTKIAFSKFQIQIEVFRLKGGKVTYFSEWIG